MRLEGFPQPLRFAPSNQRSRLRFVRSEILTWIETQQALTTQAKRSSDRRGIHATVAAGASVTE
jgi:hypothetical protein